MCSFTTGFPQVQNTILSRMRRSARPRGPISGEREDVTSRREQRHPSLPQMEHASVFARRDTLVAPCPDRAARARVPHASRTGREGSNSALHLPSALAARRGGSATRCLLGLTRSLDEWRLNTCRISSGSSVGSPERTCLP